MAKFDGSTLKPKLGHKDQCEREEDKKTDSMMFDITPIIKEKRNGLSQDENKSRILSLRLDEMNPSLNGHG